MTDVTGEEGQTLEVDATITNNGDTQDTQDVELEIINSSGEVVDTKSITLDESQDTSDTWTWQTEDGDEGTYTARIQSDDDSDSITVEVVAEGVDITNEWTFSEGSGSTVDDSEGDNDGTLVGSTWQSDSDSVEGYHVELDPNPDYLEVDDQQQFTALDDFSAFMAFRMEHGESNNHGFMGVYSTDGDNRCWRIGKEDDDYRVITSDDGSSVNDNYLTHGLSENTWHTVAVVRDASSGEIEVFEDGNSVGTITAHSGTLADIDQPLTFGSHNIGSSGTDNHLEGQMDYCVFARDTQWDGADVQELHETIPRFS